MGANMQALFPLSSNNMQIVTAGSYGASGRL
jgi:hypothetical protein